MPRTHASRQITVAPPGRPGRPVSDAGTHAGRTTHRQAGPCRRQAGLRVPPRRATSTARKSATRCPNASSAASSRASIPPSSISQERHRRVQEARNRPRRSAPQAGDSASPTRFTSVSSTRVAERQKLIEELVEAKHDFTVEGKPGHRITTRCDYAEQRGRGPRALAEADQVRPAGAAHGREADARGRGQEEDPDPLPERPQALEAGGQLRSPGTLSRRPGHQRRSAFDLHVADHAGRFRDRHAPEPGRHRGGAAAGERPDHHRGSRARRRGGQGRPAQAQGQDRRRGPGRRQVCRRDRHEAARRGQADSRAARHQGAIEGRPGQARSTASSTT